MWVSAGSLWQDSSAIELSADGSAKQIVSPRSRTRALSVAYIVNVGASVPQTEENLSLKCLKEACADAHAVFKTISFESVSLGSADILDSFYNAGKCRHAYSFHCGVIRMTATLRKAKLKRPLVPPQM